MAKRTTAKPMYFSCLTLENIKCFGPKQHLDLRGKDGKISHWTLILGENGVGKTTLLKCLSWMSPVEAPIEEEAADKKKAKGQKKLQVGAVDLKPYMDDFDKEEIYDQLIRFGDNVTASITATLTDGKFLEQTKIGDDTVRIVMKLGRTKGELTLVDNEKASVKEFNTPNLFAYSASRHLALKNVDSEELKDPIGNLFSESGDLYDAEQVLSMLDTSARRHGKSSKAANLLTKIKEILAGLLPNVKDADQIIINPPISEKGTIIKDLVQLRNEDGLVKLMELSLGYKTMLSWIVDLAVRMFWRHPDSRYPLEEPAVVIIDEIDLHLHPIWQLTVREKLTQAFPNTQFICTAHSPFMAQASIHENLCAVHRNGSEIRVENDPFVVENWRIGQISTSELFNLPSERGPEIYKSIQERRAILDKENATDDDRRRLAELDQELSSLPISNNPEDDKLMEQIRKSAERLQANGLL